MIVQSEERTAETPWLEKVAELRTMLASEDLRSFLTWPPIVSTMVFSPPVDVLRRLQTSPDWPIFQEALQETQVGSPAAYPHWPATSGNMLHQLHHFWRLKSLLKGVVDPLKVPQVVEFGGGYGCMCRLWFRLGFRGNYLIYDMPELSALQEYFLASCEIGASLGNESTVQSPSVILCQDYEVVSRQLAVSQNSPFIFVGMWSVSEAPVELRERFFPVINQASAVLMGFQDAFADVDNTIFFRRMKSQCPSLEWTQEDYPGLPRNGYVIGIRKR